MSKDLGEQIEQHIDPLARLTPAQLVAAVESGRKPLCETAELVPTHLPYISFDMFENDTYWRNYVYFDMSNKDKALRAVEMLLLDREFTEDEHIEFGTLMGYEEKNIKNWAEAMSNKAEL